MTNVCNRKNIQELTADELTVWLSRHGIETYRRQQIFRWIYQRQADGFDAMTDIKREIRQLLADRFHIARLELLERAISQDGACKYLFRLKDGQCIESVLIPERNHHTLCISSQSGCAQGCRFCMSARGGLQRNLSMGEINAQIRDVQRDLQAGQRLTNIVMMGMGEPLANYRQVVRAIGIMTDRDSGLSFSTRRVTVSTAGLVPAMLQLGRDTSVNLAVSLNAVDNRTRSRLMPINRRYPIERLLDSCRRYPLRQRRMITFEYILIRDVNDSPDAARRLAALLRPIRAKVNLIPFNEHPGSDFKRPDPATVLHFQEILQQNHYTAIIRHSKGQDIAAACGQLRAHAEHAAGPVCAVP